MRVENLQMSPVKGTLDNQNRITAETGQNVEKPFSQFLGEALNEVNVLQHKSSKAGLDLAAGKIQDLSEVAIAGEKASIALQLTMQVRNRVVEAYQEVMRITI